MSDETEAPQQPDALPDGAVHAFDLPALARHAAQKPSYEASGRGSITLVHHPGLTLVLVALRKGSAMNEHKSPHAATVVVIEGRISFQPVEGNEPLDLPAGQSVAFAADVRHAVEAIEDSVFLIAIGGA